MMATVLTPLSYDAGFDIGLKGFVAAIMGGLVSYPMAAAGAVLVGVLESLSSFWASAYREVIVFTLLRAYIEANRLQEAKRRLMLGGRAHPGFRSWGLPRCIEQGVELRSSDRRT